MTAGGSYGPGGAPAGWYRDPQDPAGQRYWNGAVWTEHTATGSAAAAPTARSRTGLIVGLAVGIPLFLVVIGIALAVAIPVFLSQREKAEDTAAKTDVALLGKEVATWYVDHSGGPPAVTVSGGEYSVDHVAVGAVSPNVQLGGITATGATDSCVWVTNPNGAVRDFEYSAQWGLAEGSC